MSGQRITVILFSILLITSQIFGQRYNPMRGLEGPCDNSKILFGGGGGQNITCEDGRVFTTPDSGGTWVEHKVEGSGSILGGDWAKIENKPSNTGTLVGKNGLILSSTDGGKNWVKVSSGTTSNLNAVVYGWCPSTKESWGYAIGDNSTVLVTKDGGKTWTQQSTEFHFDNFYDSFFYNNELGWIVGSTGIMYKTTNSGTTWTYKEVSSSNPTFKGVYFSTPTTGWVVGTGGYIGYTTNGGDSWTQQNSGITLDLNDVDARRDSDGVQYPVAVGDNGTFINDENKDGQWKKVDLGTTYNLNDISTDQQGYLWIAGDNQKLFTNKPAIVVPVAPLFDTVLADSDEVDISWKDNSDNETGFKIDRKTESSSYSQVASTAANVTKYTDKSVDDGTQYTYRIYSYNSGGNSSYSPERSVITTLKKPTSLTAKNTTSNSVQLNWKDNSKTETGFKIERKTGANGSWVTIFTTGANISSFTNIDLSPNTLYYYRLYAINIISSSVYSNEVSVNTPDVPPTAPSNLAAVVKSSSQIDLTWKDNSNNESGFLIERKKDENGNWIAADSDAVDITYHQNKNLEPNTKYYYRIAAFNSAGISAYSNIVFATTTNEIPNAPDGLAATTTSSTSVNLSWNDNSDNEDRFKILKSINENFAAADSDDVEPHSNNQVFPGTKKPNLQNNILNSFHEETSTVSHTVTGLLPNTKYYFKVAAVNAAGKSAFSNIVSATTFDIIPVAPSELVAVVKSSSQIDLVWKDNSDNESGFKIERKTGSAGNWSAVFTSSANVIIFSDVNLSPNTNYYYRVFAFNSIGNSTFSNEVSVTTTDISPVAPSELVAAVKSSSQIDLAWKDNSNNESGFKVERKTESGTFNEIVALNPNVVLFSDNPLADGIKYTYRVFAYNNIGKSDYSNEATKIALLNPPTNLTASLLGNKSVQLNWKDNSQSETGFTIERKSGTTSYSKLKDVPADFSNYVDTQILGGIQYYYRLLAFNLIINSDYSNEISILTTGIEDQKLLPDKLALHQNYPNPFNPSTVINYDVPVSCFVNLKIHNTLGKEIISLVNEYKPAGRYSVIFNSVNNNYLTSGMYFYTITTSQGRISKKMLLVK